MDTRKRIIVDFKKLTPEVLALLVEKYPDVVQRPFRRTIRLLI